jgi:hypothetical protein
MFTERAPKEAKTVVPVYGCPGIVGFATAGAGPIQGWCMMGNMLYVVSGQAFYSVAPSGIATNLGATYVTGLVSMDTNGTDIVWVDGSTGWWWSAATGVQQITDPNFYPADVVVYFDTYFCYNRKGTNQIFIGPSEGVIPFNGAMFAAKESTADNLVSIVNTHEMLLLFGESRTEVWFDAGNAPPTFPFQPYYGAFIQRGLFTPLATCLEDNTTFFLGDDGVFYRLEFTLPLRISTHATEKAWQSYPTMTGAWCYSYTVEGHKFVTLNFPSAPATWVYDIASGLWHERESWIGLDESTTIGRYRANWIMNAYNSWLVGDSVTGQIGRLSYNAYTEWGGTMRGLVSSPPIQSDRQRMFMRRFELDVESGVGVPFAPAFATLPYDLAAVQETLPVTMATASGLATLPGSFGAFLFALWVFLPDAGLPEGLWFSNQTSDTAPGEPGLQIGIFNDQTRAPQIVVGAWDSAGAPIVAATFDLTAWSAWTLFLISVDTATQTLQVWTSTGGTDTALTPASLTWSSSNPIAPSDVQPWHLVPGASTGPSPEYQMTPADYALNGAAQNVTGNPATFTGATSLLISFWVTDPAALSDVQFTWDALAGFWPWDFSFSNNGTFFLGIPSASQFAWWSYPTSALDGGAVHVVLSVDLATQQFQAYVNGVAATQTSNDMTSTSFPNQSYSPYWLFSPTSGNAALCVGDLYLGWGTSFFDLSIAANLAKFINPTTKYPVYLGATGQLPTGTAPQYLVGYPLGGGAWGNLAGGPAVTLFGAASVGTCTLYPPLISGQCDVANLFFASTAALFDLTVTANRRLFVTSDGDAVYSNGDGSSILGTKPPVFLTRVASQPVAAFATNAGSGGPFAITGGVLVDPGSAPPGANYQEELYAGDNLPAGADPQIMLDWSDDGGRTWSLLKKWRSMGKMGEYRKRLRWLKMSQARQRVLRLTVTDPVRRNFIGAYLDVEEGQK